MNPAAITFEMKKLGSSRILMLSSELLYKSSQIHILNHLRHLRHSLDHEEQWVLNPKP